MDKMPVPADSTDSTGLEPENSWWTRLKRPVKLILGAGVVLFISSFSQLWMCSCQGPWCEIRSQEIRWLTVDGRWVPTNNELVSIPVGKPVTLKFRVHKREMSRTIKLPLHGDAYISLWTKRPYLRTGGDIEVFDPITGQFMPPGNLHRDDVPRGDDQ